MRTTGLIMFYQSELSFLCDVFNKNHLHAAAVERRELIRILTEGGQGEPFWAGAEMRGVIPTLRERTLYTFTDRAFLSYRFLILPECEVPTVLIVGPYRTAQATENELLEIGEQFGIPPQKQKHFAEYYQGIPLLPADSAVWLMLNTFCERIWHSPSFAVEDATPRFDDGGASAEGGGFADTTPDELEVSMKALERRYAFENDMIRAVERGQLHVEKQLLAAFSASAFEKRVQDPLRNAKNYGIIMNTLLRKAAERGGVHPMYIDRTSSEFARQIEQMDSLERNTELMCEMFRTYCKLVQDYATRGLPEVVKRAMLHINANLSEDLSPRALAEMQGLSAAYLSTVFRRATGRTPSDYIRERRMAHAAHLLSSTNLQIQTVALHCGIMDVQYFSKLFKRQMGLTPSEYRAARIQQK